MIYLLNGLFTAIATLMVLVFVGMMVLPFVLLALFIAVVRVVVPFVVIAPFALVAAVVKRVRS